MARHRRERFLIWLFGSRYEAHRVRDRLFAYLIVVFWGWFWVGVTEEARWYAQLFGIAVIAVIPYVLLSALLDGTSERLRGEREER